MSQHDGGTTGIPGSPRPGRPAAPGADTDQALQGVEDDLELLDRTSTEDQVAIFDRMHATLADALARTADTGAPPAPADTGGPPAPGDPGA